MPFPKGAHKHSPVIKESCKPQVLELMKDKAMTTRELGKLVDRGHETVAKILRDMGENKAYICGWDGPHAIWTLGKGKHMPRPATEMSKKQAASRAKSGKHTDEYLHCRYVTGERICWGGLCL